MYNTPKYTYGKLIMMKKISKKTFGSSFDDKLTIFLIFLLIFVLVLSRIIKFGNIQSSSMAPTLKVHDLAIANRLAYKSAEPQRGDIIFFQYDTEVFGKRVIGIPGDAITFENGYVYINGEKLDEPYLDLDVKTDCTDSFLVPPDTVFVMGDNREHSYDSRYWENPYVSYNRIYGKCFFVFRFSLLWEMMEHNENCSKK